MTVASMPARPEPRKDWIERCRFLSCAGIVWFHCAAPGAWAALSGLSVFAALVVHFGLATLQRSDLRTFLRHRAARLLLPWLAWSCIFLGLKVCQAYVTGAALADEFSGYMVVTGFALHLWFLPFAFASLVVVALSDRFFSLRDAAPGTFLLVSAIVAVGVGVGLQRAEGMIPVAQWLSATPGVMLGVLLHGDAARGRGYRTTLASAVLMGAVLFSMGLPLDGVRLVIAAVALVLCLSLPPLPGGAAATFGGLSLGVYLFHPIVISVLGGVGILSRGTAAFALAVLALSCLSVIAMRRVALLRAIL